MFNDASNFDGDISKWDVSKVTDMGGMFSGASKFNGDLSKWDVSKVTDMTNMFELASSFNGDLSKWDVSKVTDMGGMFFGVPCHVCVHVPLVLRDQCAKDCSGRNAFDLASKSELSRAIETSSPMMAPTIVV